MEASDPAIRVLHPAEIEWLTEEELEQFEHLRLMLPSAGEMRAAATERVKQKREARRRELGRIDFPSEEEFLAYHRTGYIEPQAYERYEEPGGLQWVGRGATGPGIPHGEADPYERWPVPLYVRLYGPYLVEFRQSGQVLQYTKTNEEGWPVYGSDGRAIMLTPEEIRAKGLIETSPDIAAFVEGESIGLVSDEWGAVGVYIEQPFQHFGIGTDLLVEYLRRHPRFRTGKGKLGQMTPAGARLAKAAYRKMRK